MNAQSPETWTLLGVAWGAGESENPHRGAAIFEQTDHLREVCACPIPGVTLLAYRSASGALDDALRVVGNARAKAVAITGECAMTSLLGFSALSNRLYSLLSIVPEQAVICALSTFEAVRHTAGQRVVCTDLGPVGLPKIGGRERVFQVTAGGAPIPPLALDPGERAIDTLPTQFGYFVGRKPELEKCFLFLEHNLNVTITGVAGIGKSHLASRVAREVKGSYASGIAWAYMAEATTPDGIIKALAKGLGMEGSTDQAEAVRRIIVEEQLLVVLDGVDDCRELMAEMLRNQLWGAASQFIATAPRPLGYDGEEIVAVAPMTTAPPDMAPTLDDLYEFEASSLFLDRVSDLNENLLDHLLPEAVAKLTQALGGHPQALCLAAAQTRFESVEMILDGLAKRAQRQGYRRAIEGSLSGLPAMAQTTALALSLCETPISTFQLARLVPAAPTDPEALGLLMKVGLCGESISPSGRVVYSLYPSVKMHLRKARAAGRQKLRRLHECLFLALVRDSVEGHTMTARAGDLDLAEEHAPDIFVALRSLAGRVSTACFYETVRSIYPFLYDHNHINEGIEVLEAKIARAKAGEALDVARLLNIAATLATKAGRSEQARAFCGAAIERLDAADDGLVRAAIISNMAILEWSEGKPELARDQFAFAIDLFKHLGRDDQVAKVLVSSVIAHIECDDSEAAETAMRQVEAFWGSPTPLQRWCLQLGRGQVEWAKGNLLGARRNFRDSVRMAQEMSDELSLLRSLMWLSQALSDVNADKDSTHVLAVAAHNQTELAYRLHKTNQMRVERVRERLNKRLGEAKYRTEFIAGSIQGLDQVLASIY